MPKPRYQRLADMLAKAIHDGKLAPGSKLPTHRAFADQAGVALATATRVYNDLEKRGLVVGEAGRGTFVRTPSLPATLGMQQTETDGTIDLVFNMPESNTDADHLRKSLKRLSTSGDLQAMLSYQPHGGRRHECQQIAQHLTPTLGAIDPDQLLITSGAQHGLSLTTLALFKQGDAIAIDPLTYPGFKSAAALKDLKLFPIPTENGAMDPEALDHACQTHPLRAVYLMPTVHSPLGTVMTQAQREALIQVARKHDLWLIEDAAYASLEPSPPPSLITLAPERTIHIGGFSKSLATGLRLGYIIPPAPHVDTIREAIRATTWSAPALITNLVTGWIEDGMLAKTEQQRRLDGAARQALCRQAFHDMPLIGHPNASFAWLPLPEGTRAEPIVSQLQTQGIVTSTAEAFATSTAIPQALRLAFGGHPTQDLPQIFQTIRNAIKNAQAT